MALPVPVRSSAPRRILISGASSGLGAALARAYAGPGISLILWGRDSARLEAVARDCQRRKATVETALVDVTDRDATAQHALAADQAAPLDLVIANAGISAGTGAGSESEEQTRDIFAVNLAGVLNTVQPLLPRLRARRAGQIALMASLAGFRGIAGAPAYCASKAAVRIWGEGLRALLAAEGVRVSVICPGFVRTPMTDVNPFPMPLLMEADRAAALIKRRLAKNRGRIAFPWPMALLAWLAGTLPDPIMTWVSQQLPRKG